MRTSIRLFLPVLLAAAMLPLAVQASVPDPFIYKTRLVNTPAIVGAPYGTYQTALRAGNTAILQAYFHSTSGLPLTISADFSSIGLPLASTTSDFPSAGYTQYDPAYFYSFDTLSIGADIADGLYNIPIEVTDTDGNSSATTTQIRIDNVSPTISLSKVEFASSTPEQFGTMYLSGSASGTGSVLKVSSVDQMLLDEGGKTISEGYSSSIAGPNMQALSDAFAASTDGTYARVPLEVFWGYDASIDAAASLKVVLTGYDEAGLKATSSLTVPILRGPPPDPCIAAGTCVSNVLFLPGIEGSRLYEGTGCGKVAEEKLWDPLIGSVTDILLSILRGAGDAKVGDLALDASGASACADIYTKPGDVVDTAGGSNIYKTFLDEMNGLKTAGTIADWQPVSYDWRLSLGDLLSKGAEHDGKIYYEEATSTPYIEQTLRALAASSKTGKVTIIAHSNGGLVAKALLRQLGDTAAASLVDKVIMVGVPQSGAPADVGSLLVGYGAGLYAWKGIGAIVSNVAARTFVQNSPMAYHLLPSQNYFDSVMNDAAHPVARFAGDAYAKEISAYGISIGTLTELDDFLLAKDGGRTEPRTGDLMTAEILNPSLIAYANSTHTALDSWAPPAGIEVDQIAGWGVDTVGGVDFYTAQPTAAVTAFDPYRTYKPIFIEDGDGTVPVPSALMMAESADVKRYWVNLAEINDVPGVKVKRSHADLFEIQSLEDFIKNILQSSTSSLPAYISASQPAPTVGSKTLTFFLHSPLTLELTDASGQVTGLAEDGTVTQGIPGSSYGEFGEVKYISVPQGSTYQLAMHGQASGTFALDMQESVGGTITTSSTIASVPTTASTLASLSITDGIDTASPLTVDENGDGKSVITIAPKSGETVTYEPPAPVPPAPTVGSGAGGSPAPVVVAPVAAPAPVVEPLATSTPEVVPVVPAPEESLATTTEPVAVPVATTTTPAAPTVAIATPRRQVAVAPRPSAYSPAQAQSVASIPQTAAVYDAISQQPFLKKVEAAVYNSLYGFWSLLKKFF